MIAPSQSQPQSYRFQLSLEKGETPKPAFDAEINLGQKSLPCSSRLFDSEGKPSAGEELCWNKSFLVRNWYTSGGIAEFSLCLSYHNKLWKFHGKPCIKMREKAKRVVLHLDLAPHPPRLDLLQLHESSRETEAQLQRGSAEITEGSQEEN